MGLFTDEYKKLLIVQYSDKPKALATIESLLAPLEDIYDNMFLLEDAFDLDKALGVQLDVIGKIVGISREVPFVVPKNFFGFQDNTLTAYPMGNKFLNVIAYPIKDKFELDYSTGILDDYRFRIFIKAKIAKNYAVAKFYSENGISLPNALDYLFSSKSYVVDNKNMSMTIYIDREFDINLIQYIKQLDLIPRPQGVRYKAIIQYSDKKTFGFGVNNTGFGDKFSNPISSYFATKIL